MEPETIFPMIQEPTLISHTFDDPIEVRYDLGEIDGIDEITIPGYPNRQALVVLWCNGLVSFGDTDENCKVEFLNTYSRCNHHPVAARPHRDIHCVITLSNKPYNPGPMYIRHGEGRLHIPNASTTMGYVEIDNKYGLMKRDALVSVSRWMGGPV